MDLRIIFITFGLKDCCMLSISNAFLRFEHREIFSHVSLTLPSKSWTSLRYIRIPAALPMIASGIKISVVMAPIGAVIGEWSGSSEGLGHFMMYCNSRMEVAGMFAALITLSLGAISLFYATDYSLKKALFWLDNTTNSLQ